MRFAINHISAPKLPLAEFFAMCRRLGVTGTGCVSYLLEAFRDVVGTDAVHFF